MNQVTCDGTAVDSIIYILCGSAQQVSSCARHSDERHTPMMLCSHNWLGCAEQHPECAGAVHGDGVWIVQPEPAEWRCVERQALSCS